ncbi:MAG: hypothetical protein ABIZ70_13710 [Gemmatimonadales bacterium]
MSTPRRDFLGWLGASALLGATASPLAASTPPAESDPRALAIDYDMTWTDKLTGKYRAVFDSPMLSEGAALFRAVVWQDHYKAVYGTDPKEMTPVVVFRHEAIPLVMSDAYWERFEVGEKAKLRDAKGKKWTKVNPIRAAAPGAPPAAGKYTLETFLANGGIVLACNMAFSDVVGNYMKADKLKRDEARKKALEQLIPGVILQPSGVFAALRAQQGGCGYILAS